MDEATENGGGPSGALEPAAIVEAIRASSAAAALCCRSALSSRFPRADIAALVGASGAADLRLIEGRTETYYFSELSMTRAYAVHLFHVAEKDPLRMVAETVREESRLYPRPTDLRTFLDPPFGLTPSELAATVGALELQEEGRDIAQVRASNGALYLYCTSYLVPALALSLAEWIEVGQKDNP